MTVAAVVLGLALVSGGAMDSSTHARARVSPRPEARACIAPDRTGTFRLTAVKVNGTEPQPAMLVMENIDGCLEVTFVTDERAPAIVDELSLNGDTLNGSLRLSTGAAKVSLKFTPTGIAGSITKGHDEWRLEGRRTS
jgi:hypothetical protein